MKKTLTLIGLIFLSCQLQAQVSFVLTSSPSPGTYPQGVTAADVNGDGKLELISANSNDNTLSVLTNNGSGSFAVARTYAVGNHPFSVVAVDVNGDGKMDLISANQNDNTLTVLTNDGSGSFVLASSPSVGHVPCGLTAADVNGDGKVDLICANSSGNTLTVLTNNGHGGFVTAGTYAVGNSPRTVVAADVNGDGKLDLICANPYDNTLSVLTNNGSGGFVLAASPGVGSAPIWVAAADVNGDGKVDLISANLYGNTLSILTNDGSGGFVLALSPTVGNGPACVTAADVNGDGKLDLISANAYGSSLSVLTNATPYPRATPPCDPAPSGLISWWPGEGNANDIIGGNNGVVTNGVIAYSTGEVGSAFHYNGGGYVEIPASPSLNVGLGAGFTLEGWIQPGDLVNQMPLFEWQFDGVAGGVHFWTSAVGGAGCLYANVMDAANNAHPFSSPAGILTTGYQHVALTYDKSTGQASIYRNGALVASANLGIFTPKTASNLLLGERTYLGGASQFKYTGDLDEMSVYGRALSSNEVAAIYVAGSAGKCPPPPPPLSCDPAPSGLVSWWPGEGNANDIVGGNNGVPTGGITYTNGEVDQAFVFNGSTSYIRVPASPSLNNIGASGSGVTIECWVKPSSTANGPIMEWDSATVDGLQFWIQNNFQLFANIKDASGNSHAFYTGLGVLNSTNFQHVALTYDKNSGNAFIYLNGGVVASANFGNITPQTTYPYLRIGQRSAAAIGTYTYTGLIDELGLYNRALSAAEIAAIYNAGSAGKCPLPPPPPLPEITTQPTNQTVTMGSMATFSVTASSPSPLSYQWSCNTTNIAGATNATLILNNVQFTQAGNYTVLVANNAGSTKSIPATLTVNPLPPCDPAPSGLVSWWPGEGNANDIVSGNNGVPTGSIAYTAGKAGQAFVFNGSTSYIPVPASPSLDIGATGSGITIEGWINPASSAENAPIVEWDSPSTDGLQFWVQQPLYLYANINDTGGHGHLIYSANGTVATNVWQHAALTYDKASGVAVIYLNGNIVATNNLGSFTPQTTYPMNIGRRTGQPIGLNDTFNGGIDELGLYNRALSATEVAAIYNAGSTGKCPPALVPPMITTQPASQTVTMGNTATFNVVADGTAPLSYQWSRNTTNIAGATNATLTLNNVQLSEAGNYSVRITNPASFIVSGNAALTVTVPTCTPASSGLISWWPGEGNANDIVGGNNGVPTGGITYTNGKVGQAFVFNGSTSYIPVPASPSLDIGATGSGISIECWVNPVSAAGNGPIVEWDSPSTDGLQFWIQPPLWLYANLPDTSGHGNLIYTAHGTVATGVWQHVALTYDKASGMAVIYLNGNIVATNNLGSFTPQTTYPMNIGRRTGQPIGLNDTFNGLIDELGLYNRALSSAEITAIYNAGSAGKCVPVYPPIIITQPTNHLVTVGDSVSFSVTASGTTPLSYQWRLNTTNIAGATNAMLTLNTVQLSDAGNYSVTVTNLYGSATSSNARLKVNQPPVANATATAPLVISVNNSNATVILNGSLSYDPDGNFLQYTWYQTGSSSPIASGVVAVVILPVGTNSITLKVNDGLASSQQTITVQVVTLAQAVDQLKAVINTDVSKKQSLIATLNAALGAIDRGHPMAAINQLQAFQHQVSAQISPLDPALAQTLIDEAQSIINALAGSPAPHKPIKAWNQSNGKMHLNFSGMHQQVYIIEASTNMVDWQMIGVAQDQGDGTFNFDDADAPQIPQRYYRIVVP